MTRARRTRDERAFEVEVATMLKLPGSRREVSISAPMRDLAVSGSHVPDGEEVRLDAVLESVSGGILVTGHVRTRYVGECRRCLEVARGELDAEVCELCCENADDETTYPLHGDLLDLAPLVHDACILELPLAPLCSTDCRGLCPVCGANRNLEPCACEAPRDPRWAALGVLSDDAKVPADETGPHATGVRDESR